MYQHEITQKLQFSVVASLQPIRRPVPCPPVGKTGAMANYKTKNWQCPEVSLHCRFGSLLRAARTSNPSPLHMHCHPQRNLGSHRAASRSVPTWAEAALRFRAERADLQLPARAQRSQSAGKGPKENNKKRLPSHIHVTAKNNNQSRNINVWFQRVNLAKDHVLETYIYINLKVLPLMNTTTHTSSDTNRIIRCIIFRKN